VLYELIRTEVGEKDTIAYEIAHILGAVHEDKEPMGEPPGLRNFSEESLSKTISAKYP
jgi:hypothetical protein